MTFAQPPDLPRDFMRQFLTCEWTEAAAPREACWEQLLDRVLATIGPEDRAAAADAAIAADAAAGPQTVAAPQPAPAPRPQPTAMPETPRPWHLREERDPISLRPAFFANQEGLRPTGETISGRRGVSLHVRCRNGRLDVFALFEGSFSFMRDDVRVEVRVGQQAGLTETWNVASSREGVFSANPQALLARMIAADEMVLRVTLESVGTSTAHYDLRQFRTLIEPLRAACPAPRPAPQQPRPPGR